MSERKTDRQREFQYNTWMIYDALDNDQCGTKVFTAFIHIYDILHAKQENLIKKTNKHYLFVTFNETCRKENLLPKYICACVCACACWFTSHFHSTKMCVYVDRERGGGGT